MGELIWRPQPKQAEFLSRGEFEALYGGAAGGGKSDALIIEALRQVHIPHYKCLILRKTFPQLRELIDKSFRYYRQAYPRARYNQTAHTWTFPSGAKIIFGSLNTEASKYDYQGQAYDVIMFDEITQFQYSEYMYLMSRCRPNGPGTQCYIRCTGNPGGIGHQWVKERFITAAEPMTTVWSDTEWYDNTGAVHHSKRSRVFVPSTVFDNKALLANDPNYVMTLASLPEAEKKALLYGSWDSFSGQVFTEFKNDPKHYDDRLNTHVIKPFVIPKDWAIWCGLDWGYSKPFSVGWYAVDHERRLYRIREYYGCSGEPNHGVFLEPTEVAKTIKEIENEDPNLIGRTIHRVGDPAIWGTQGTESIGALFERQQVYFEKADHARLDGKMQVHHRLVFDDEGVPLFYCFNTCKHFIRTFPNLIYDDVRIEDVDTDGEDHIYDEFRYVCMKNPIAPPVKKVQKPKPYNPLDTDRPADYRYSFYDL